MWRQSTTWSIMLGLLGAVSTTSAADPPNAKLAITDINEVDEDFAFQGEYAGTVLTGTGPWYRRNMGLQVVAQGDGKFIGVVYAEGLPGAGWDRISRIPLVGDRTDDELQMMGGPLYVNVRRRYAEVGYAKYPNDPPVGRLLKTHRVSSTLNASPPPGATVLFDGTNTDHFENGRMTDDGLLMVGTQLKRIYRDYTLHLEFRLPYMPFARGQGRSNSGVYLQSRYEVQILDSFGLKGERNECGGLYKYREPDINMCFPPLSWQTIDVKFTSPQFDTDGKKIRNARLTVWHNGLLVHNDFELERKTGAGRPEGANLLPIMLQDHHNPVRFRNIWIVDDSSAHDHPTTQPCVITTVAAAARPTRMLSSIRDEIDSAIAAANVASEPQISAVGKDTPGPSDSGLKAVSPQ